ncbi:MAG TPA: hypothetical protein VH724_16380, partial [Candidatus Angelobacter sp.]|nr:hypothetical protein [Candidatus Angelobacter sp.]
AKRLSPLKAAATSLKMRANRTSIAKTQTAKLLRQEGRSVRTEIVQEVIGPTVAEAVVAAAGEDLGVAAGVVVAAHVVVIAAHAVVAEIAATARTAISKIAISLELRINALKCLIAIFFWKAALSCKRLTIHCGVTPLSAARHKRPIANCELPVAVFLRCRSRSMALLEFLA